MFYWNHNGITDLLKLPKESIYHDMVVTVIGKSEAMVENYKGIIDYCNTCILLQGVRYKVAIRGQKLCILYYTDTDMKIKGEICRIEYM